MSDKICPFFYGSSVPALALECLEDKCALWCEEYTRCSLALLPNIYHMLKRISSLTEEGE